MIVMIKKTKNEQKKLRPTVVVTKATQNVCRIYNRVRTFEVIN
jgi:hypothetical protein